MVQGLGTGEQHANQLMKGLQYADYATRIMEHQLQNEKRDGNWIYAGVCRDCM